MQRQQGCVTDLWVNRVSGKVRMQKAESKQTLVRKMVTWEQISQTLQLQHWLNWTKISHKSSKETINSETYSVTCVSHRLRGCKTTWAHLEGQQFMYHTTHPWENHSLMDGILESPVVSASLGVKGCEREKLLKRERMPNWDSLCPSCINSILRPH